mmetsp:Transcript_5538/g.9883  ORF Transcript_5538/g.9883 Transcript_5538/m.9883 type:complete len:191 (+) Transcript_5538:82-654(+)
MAQVPRRSDVLGPSVQRGQVLTPRVATSPRADRTYMVPVSASGARMNRGRAADLHAWNNVVPLPVTTGTARVVPSVQRQQQPLQSQQALPVPVEAQLLHQMVLGLTFTADNLPCGGENDHPDWSVVRDSARPLLTQIRKEGEANLAQSLRHAAPGSPRSPASARWSQGRSVLPPPGQPYEVKDPWLQKLR